MSGRALRAGTLRAAPTSSSAATYFPSAACSSPAANNVLPSVWGRVARTPGECPPACRRNKRGASWACLGVCGLRQVGQHRTPELGQRHGHCAKGDGHRARLCVSFCGRDRSGHVEATHLASSRAPAGAPSRSWVYHSCRQPFRGGKNTRTRPRRGRKHARTNSRNSPPRASPPAHVVPAKQECSHSPADATMGARRPSASVLPQLAVSSPPSPAAARQQRQRRVHVVLHALSNLVGALLPALVEGGDVQYDWRRRLRPQPPQRRPLRPASVRVAVPGVHAVTSGHNVAGLRRC